MAFPFTFHANFEAGGVGEFDSEVDANGVLNVKHYADLIKQGAPLPYEGAFAMEVDLAGADTNQYVQEDDGFDVALDATLNVRFMLYVSSALTMAASDRFTVFAMQSTGPTDEIVVDIRNNAGTIEILAAETGSASTVRAGALILDAWHAVELAITLDDGASDDGSIDFYLDDKQVSTQLASLDQAAIIQARLGVIGKDAGTTAGKLFFSEIIADDARLFKPLPQFSNPVTVTKSGQFFFGPGDVDLIQLLKTSDSDEIVRLYDTDDARDWATDGTPDSAEQAKAELTGSVAVARTVPCHFERGCWVQLAGTNSKARVGFAEDTDIPGIRGAAHDEPSIRNWARMR